MALLQEENGKLVYRFDGETLVIEPWGKNSLRVRSRIFGEPEDTRYALLEPEPVQPVIRVGETEASLTNGKITAVLKINGWTKGCRITYYDQAGKVLLQERAEGGALGLKPRCYQPILGGDFHLTAGFESDPEEKLYGMGQYQQDKLNVKNCLLELAHRNSQASVPFVVSSLGYGFLWHNPAVGKAYFGGNVTEWYAESTKQMDYWITAGDTPAEIVEAYGTAVGKVPMMPEYGLGFWQCKLRYWNQEQLLEVAREYYRRKVPVDVIVCDFFHWPKMGDYRFDEEFFPDPAAMVRELKEMGMELMVSVWPQVDVQSENYGEMQAKGYLTHVEKGVNVSMLFVGNSNFFDATNPDARSYVWEKCRQNYYQDGIRIFWLDEAEPEFGAYDFDNYRYYMGPNVQIGNVYPQLYARTFYDGMTAEGQKQVVNLIRCAWAGSQRYGALVWSGDIHSDYETLRRQVCAGLNMGMAGIPWWTTDIGGFSDGNPDDEWFRKLLVRWFEWGTFCPVMRLHGDRYQKDRRVFRKDGTEVLGTGGDNEIWSYGEEVCEILTKYIRQRERMRPYTRQLMKEAHEAGTPVMRTMFYVFPEDKTCWELKEQYMYGADILVAPMLYEEQYERDVYLPEGTAWIDAWTKQTYGGGQTIRVHAGLAEIPVFVRSGSSAIEFFV